MSDKALLQDVRKCVDDWAMLSVKAEEVSLKPEQIAAIEDDFNHGQYEQKLRETAQTIHAFVHVLEQAFAEARLKPDLALSLKQIPIELVVGEMSEYEQKLSECYKLLTGTALILDKATGQQLVQAKRFNHFDSFVEEDTKDDSILMLFDREVSEKREAKVSPKKQTFQTPKQENIPAKQTKSSSRARKPKQNGGVPANPDLAAMQTMLQQFQAGLQEDMKKADSQRRQDREQELAAQEKEHARTRQQVEVAMRSIQANMEHRLSDFELRVRNLEQQRLGAAGDLPTPKLSPVQTTPQEQTSPPYPHPVWPQAPKQYQYFDTPQTGGKAIVAVPVKNESPISTEVRGSSSASNTTQAFVLTDSMLAALHALVPAQMLVTADGKHLFEQFNSELSREERRAYRGPYAALHQGANLPTFDGTGEFKTHWMRFAEKANQICISDGEKLDLLRSSLTGYIAQTVASYEMSTKGLYDAVLQLFEGLYQNAERQLKALKSILSLPPVSEDFENFESTFGTLRSAARELEDTNSNDVRTKQDILEKLPKEVRRSFLLRFPGVISNTPMLDLVIQLQGHTRTFANQRQVQLARYEIQAQRTQCPFCQERGHRPSLCAELKGTRQQWDVVLQQGRCLICLENDHNCAGCEGVKCGKCGQDHHTKFHQVLVNPSTANTQNPAQKAVDRNSNQNTSHQPSQTIHRYQPSNQTTSFQTSQTLPRTQTPAPATPQKPSNQNSRPVTNNNQQQRNNYRNAATPQVERRTTVAEEVTSSEEDEEEETDQALYNAAMTSDEDFCGPEFFRGLDLPWKPYREHQP